MSSRVFTALGIVALIAGLQLPVEAASSDANFVSHCTYSHSAPDDPIVFPGQPGASHPHDFLGNRSTNATSTYGSLRSAGTTCKLTGDKAGYWTPALYDSGELVLPMFANVYYTLGGKNPLSVRAFPAGLKVVAKGSNIRARWSCRTNGQSSAPQIEPPTCPGGQLVQAVRFPDCWDATRLDSPDHTSHLTFARTGRCPSSHPRAMPAINVIVHYPSDGGDIVLGSPDMPVDEHADFFNAWHQPTLERFVRECLNAGRRCGMSPPSA